MKVNVLGIIMLANFPVYTWNIWTPIIVSPFVKEMKESDEHMKNAPPPIKYKIKLFNNNNNNNLWKSLS